MTEQDLQAANQLINTANAAAANYAIMSGKTDHRTMNYNKELMSIQHQYNIEDWKRQADYNSPTAAIARLRGAGLNPILHDLQGNATAMQGVSLGSAPNASDSANSAQSNFIAAMNANLTSQSLQIAKKNSETERINAETARQNADTQRFKAEVDAGLTQEQTTYQKALTVFQEWQNSHNEDKFIKDMSKMQSEIDLNDALRQVNAKKLDEISTNIENSKKITQATVDELSALASSYVASATLANLQAENQRIQNYINDNLKEYEISNGIHSSSKIRQELEKTIQEVINMKKQGKEIDAQIRYIRKLTKNANLSDYEKSVFSALMLGSIGGGSADKIVSTVTKLK